MVMKDPRLPKSTKSMLGFPEISGTILGVPTLRTIVFWSLYWGSPILGNYHVSRFFSQRGGLKVFCIRSSSCDSVRSVSLSLLNPDVGSGLP